MSVLQKAGRNTASTLGRDAPLTSAGQGEVKSSISKRKLEDGMVQYEGFISDDNKNFKYDIIDLIKII